MTLSEQMADDLAVFLNTDEFATSVVFDNGTDPAVTVSAVVDYDAFGQYHADCAVVYINDADLPAAPVYRDQVTIDGDTWRVIRDDKKGSAAILDNGLWSLKVIKDERYTGWT